MAPCTPTSGERALAINLPSPALAFVVQLFRRRPLVSQSCLAGSGHFYVGISTRCRKLFSWCTRLFMQLICPPVAPLPPHDLVRVNSPPLCFVPPSHCSVCNLHAPHEELALFCLVPPHGAHDFIRIPALHSALTLFCLIPTSKSPLRLNFPSRANGAFSSSLI